MQLVLVQKNCEHSAHMNARLAETGFVPVVVQSPDQISHGALAQSAQAILLDVDDCCEDGARQVRRLRALGLNQPIIVVSNHGNGRDRVACLDAGADDCVLKPISAEEISARFRTIFRRCAGNVNDRIVVGPITLDLKAKLAWLDRQPLELTRNEFRLLRLFVLHQDRILSNQEIRNYLYQGESGRSTNAIEVHIARLRQKIGRNMVRTVRGIGYCLANPPIGYASIQGR